MRDLLQQYEATRVPFAMGGALVWVSSDGETEIDLVMSSQGDALGSALRRAAGWQAPPSGE